MQTPRASEQVLPDLAAEAPPSPGPLYLGALPDHWHAVPDTVLDGADLQGLSIRGASLRGSRHRREGVVRQDAMGIYPVSANGIEAVLGVVADGVDGEPLSHLGAEQTCLIVRDEVRARLSQLFSWQMLEDGLIDESNDEIGQVCLDIVQSAADRLSGRATFLHAKPKALSTSLAVVVVDITPADKRLNRFVTFRVGDSSAFFGNGASNVDIQPIFGALEPRQGDHPTTSLPTSANRVSKRSGWLGGRSWVAVCTSGLDESLRRPDIESQVKSSWSNGRSIPTLPEFASQVAVEADGTDADRTAICFWGR